MTAFVNGRQIHQAPLSPECDPWLAFHCRVEATGGARNIAITGRPEIPEQLNLSALPDLTGWLADYYGDSVTGDKPDWEKQGEEIIGRLRGHSWQQAGERPALSPADARGWRDHLRVLP